GFSTRHGGPPAVARPPERRPVRGAGGDPRGVAGPVPGFRFDPCSSLRVGRSRSGATRIPTTPVSGRGPVPTRLGWSLSGAALWAHCFVDLRGHPDPLRRA